MPKQALRPGKIKCLKCQKPFDSRDVCTNRICVKCARDNLREYVPHISSTRTYTSESGD